MPRILIEIAPEHWQKLRTLAGTQYRDTRRQAQLIIDQALTAALEAEADLVQCQEVAHGFDAQDV